jgi:tyrosyl-tRNA synthetase
MDVDLEIGGNDQTFNMLAGRTLSKAVSGKEKMVLTTELLSDPTGNKMGKTTGNMITLVDTPADMYGKVMSWTDEMILPAMEILTDLPVEEIRATEKTLKNGANPRDSKMRVAFEVVKVYLGEKSAKEAEANFKQIFQEGGKPTEITEVIIPKDKLTDGQIGVLSLFVAAGLGNSNGEIRRLIQEGAILIDDQKISDANAKVSIPPTGLLLQRGKKMFAKVFIK